MTTDSQRELAFGEYTKVLEMRRCDWERLITVSRFPEAQGKHLRTTNLVKSPLAQVRRRPNAAQRDQRVENAEAIIGKCWLAAEPTFRTLNGAELVPVVQQGVPYVDGKPVASPVTEEWAGGGAWWSWAGKVG